MSRYCRVERKTSLSEDKKFIERKNNNITYVHLKLHSKLIQTKISNQTFNRQAYNQENNDMISIIPPEKTISSNRELRDKTSFKKKNFSNLKQDTNAAHKCSRFRGHT